MAKAFLPQSQSEGPAEGGVWSLPFRRARAFRRSEAEAVNQGSPQNGSDFFKQTPHFRKPQVVGSRLASLGCHFVLYFGGKNELAVSFGVRKIFNHTNFWKETHGVSFSVFSLIF